MRILVLFFEVLLSLNNYRFRSVLTALGVMIGVCAIFLTLNISRYITTTLNKELIPLSKTLIVLPRPITVNGVNTLVRQASHITSTDNQAIKQLNFVQFSTPILIESSQVISAYDNIDTLIIGSEESYFKIVNLTISRGEFFVKEDVNEGQKVAVIGVTVANQLFPSINPINQNITIKNISFRVIGIIKKQGPSLDGKDRDNLIVIPISTAKQRFYNDFNVVDAVDYIFLAVNNSRLIKKNKAKITELLSIRHKNLSVKAQDFKIEDREKEVTSVNFIFNTISFSLLLISGITLIVSGIGISTLMLMAISERKHEIGLKKAIGAANYEIMAQVLLESMAISLFGGLIGALIGSGALYFFNLYTHLNIVINLYYLIPCIVIALLLGIIAGLFPAYLTIKIQAITALNE